MAWQVGVIFIAGAGLLVGGILFSITRLIKLIQGDTSSPIRTSLAMLLGLLPLIELLLFLNGYSIILHIALLSRNSGY